MEVLCYIRSRVLDKERLLRAVHCYCLVRYAVLTIRYCGQNFNMHPSSQPLGRLAEISLKWLLLRPYDKGEETCYAAVARAGTHIGHLQRRVRENIGALTLVQDHG